MLATQKIKDVTRELSNDVCTTRVTLALTMYSVPSV